MISMKSRFALTTERRRNPPSLTKHLIFTQFILPLPPECQTHHLPLTAAVQTVKAALARLPAKPTTTQRRKTAPTVSFDLPHMIISLCSVILTTQPNTPDPSSAPAAADLVGSSSILHERHQPSCRFRTHEEIKAASRGRTCCGGGYMPCGGGAP
jgi:hypothetical protein